jgi:hypothetical protein
LRRSWRQQGTENYIMNLLETKRRLDALGDIASKLPISPAAPDVQNLVAFRKLVDESRGIPGIEQVIGQLERNRAFQSNQPNMRVSEDVRTDLVNGANNLSAYLHSLQSFLKSLGLAQPVEADIYIKFAHANDLPALTDQLTKFQTILEQTILEPAIGGKMEVRSVDKGSIWVHLFVGSVTAVTVIGSLAWAAAVVYRKVQEGRLVQEHVRSLGIKNDALSSIQLAQEQLLKGIVEAEARHLEKENFSGEENPERLQRIKHSISLMQELIEKGAEVYPALMQPEKVQNLFPNFKKLNAVESHIKKIAEKADGSS